MQAIETDPRDRVGSRQPIFPDFKPLEMRDQAEIEAFTRQFDPYSDFCFSTLILYNGNGHTRWCWLNGNFVLRFSDSFGTGIFLTFIGNKNAAATAATLVDYALEMDFTPTLWRIPEVTAKAIANKTDCFDIEEDRGGFDYVYNLETLSQLKGSALYEFRKDMSRFESRHPGNSFVQLDIDDQKINAQIRSAISTWQSKKVDVGMAQSYCQALENCLRDANEFNMLWVGIIIHGSLAGFAECERVREAWLLSHFAITNPEFPGIHAYLQHRLARWGLGLGFTHLNVEEDLGSSGLRRFKMKCAPTGFLRKFSVSRKEGFPCCS